MFKKLLFCVLFVFIITETIKAQESLKIQGIVRDEFGQALPGATIVVKGTTKGTFTDLEGAFAIDVKTTDIVVTSFIGYENQEVLIGNQKDLMITLTPELSSLDEVIVTALGITKAEKSVGYATQRVDVKRLQEIPSTNVGSLLSGQVSGLQVSNPPGLFQTPTFSLRGKTPLIVLDDIPTETDFFDVVPEDIVSINVLKGTSASVLYGSRGRNGAILITTKNATKEGLEVSLSQNVMVSAGFTVYPKSQREYGSGSNGKYEFWDGKDGGISDGDMNWGPKFVPGLEIAQWNSPIRDKQTGVVIPWYGNVEGTDYDDKSRFERVPIPWQSHNNLKEFLETGLMTTTNFSVASKSEKSSYRLSGSFSSNKDKVPNAKLFRGNLGFRSTSHLTDKLSLDSKITYNKSYSPSVPNYSYNPSGHMYTALIWMGSDVNGRELKNNLWVPGQEGYKQANFNYAWYNNPWFSTEYFKRKVDKDIVTGQLVLKYKLLDNLQLQGRASSRIISTNTELNSPKSYLNYSTSREGAYSISEINSLKVDYDFLAMYNTDITHDILLSVNAGAASRYEQYRSSYAATDGLTAPGVYNLGNSTGPVTATNHLEKKAVNSVYTSMEVDLYDTFFFTFAGRNDWSSALSKDNRSYFYPSTSLSVLASNIIPMPKEIDYLKLYTSWAQVSSDLSPYQLHSAYLPVRPPYNGNQMVTYPTVIMNPDLLPQKSESFELGLSTSLFKKRLHFDATYYKVLDSNFIIDFPVSEASGFDSQKVNGNEYTTNGFEISLSSEIIKKTNFSWRSNINWSTQEKKLTKIHNNAEKYGNLSLNERSDSYYGSVWLKSPDGKVILNERTGMPTIDPVAQKLGNSNPAWSLGFQNNFKYKEFSLSIGIDGIWGGLMRSEVVEKMWWGGKHQSSTLYRDEEYSTGNFVYVPEGVNVVSGSLVRDVQGNIISDDRVFAEHTKAVSWQSWAQNYPYRGRVTEKESKMFANVFDRTHFKLRTVAFGYDFTKMIKSKTLSHLSATLTGYNLFIWKKSKGLLSDPDYNTSGSNDIQDPSARWIGLGVNVKF